ncbi:transcription factor MYB3R-2-like, partial [Olea europaea var. sylvestris]|uniref:transcription factor MYB3R-2-like n=1 Tax=Olea europaea var. sylvestris TaxID=158386 RepID=UPI000C1D0F01
FQSGLGFFFTFQVCLILGILGRCFSQHIGKQCRDRWNNHLNPEINKGAWTKEEDEVLISAHAVYGNKWAEMAKLLPGRLENSIKNR